MANLEGRTALVTGAARGLGGATAKALCEAGASVMLTDVLAEGEETARQLRDAGYRAAFFAHDVRKEDQWRAAVDAAIAAFGDINILVNNAGITHSVTFEDATLADYQHMLDINLLGAFLGMKAVLPSMKRAGNGSIVNIASNSTQMVLALTSIYSSAKAALANLSKTAAVHCAEQGYGIRVNTVHPGPHATPMLLGGGTAEQAAEIPQVKAVINAIPMKRMGNASEIGKVVTFLASDDASYMTGSEVFVDGGLTIV
jgi:3alpha(or 20beta)-hydroxysteroid dehydrogenase